MVLSSQMPREGTGRRHMVSRRRRRPMMPIVGLVVAAGLVVALVMWRGDGNASANNGQDGARDVEAQTDGPLASQPAVRDEPSHAAVTPPTSSPPPVRELSSTGRVAASPPPAQPVAPEPAPTPTPPPSASRATRTPVAPTETFQPNVSDGPRTAATVQSKVQEGMSLIAAGDLVKGRDVLNRVLLDHARQINARDEQMIRDAMASVNRTLVFSKTITPGDPLVDRYVVQSGDRLLRIAPAYKVPYQIIEHINSVSANRIQVGQTLKMIKGPFHAVVVKSAFRIDLYLEGADGRPVYITSYSVGLGEGGSTPMGLFRVGVKLENPGWTNPRTGETYGPDDPRNPIGEHWLSLEGIDDNTRDLRSYGIHGTIEPQSIGSQASMGCVRLRDDDVQMIFNMLSTGESTVRIVP